MRRTAAGEAGRADRAVRGYAAGVNGPQHLRARRLGIDTYTEPVVFLRSDCPVTRSEGFEARAQVRVTCGERVIGAVLMVVTSELLASDEAGFSEAAWRALCADEGDRVEISHLPPLQSFSHVRSKIYGNRLDPRMLEEIVADIAHGRYADIQLAAFLTACAGSRLDLDEITALTRAMVDTGERMDWGVEQVVDKHCVGGLPGNRTTPIVVSIVAAFGCVIPKTSSRAITSPAGTADTMEVMAPVNLSVEAMRKVVEQHGGCIVWGGAMRLAPVDDMLIRVEHPLNLDSEGQLVASILSKKLAAGSSHVLIDLPVGPSAKVRSPESAEHLTAALTTVGSSFGLQIRCVQTDGVAPVGRGVGPADEARDVLAVLRREPGAPRDLRDRSVHLAGLVLEMSGKVAAGAGEAEARRLLREGAAWEKFHAICEAQGGFREPPRASLTWPVRADHDGVVTGFDNRKLASVAKFAGAPVDKAAGLRLEVGLGDRVERGQPLFTVHAESPGELDYALQYVASSNGSIVAIGEPD